MDLNSYFLSGAKRRSELADEIGVHPVLVSQWIHGVRRVPAERCPAIERASGGAVRCEELRPDVDWTYLRGTASPTSEEAGAALVTAPPALVEHDFPQPVHDDRRADERRDGDRRARSEQRKRDRRSVDRRDGD